MSATSCCVCLGRVASVKSTRLVIFDGNTSSTFVLVCVCVWVCVFLCVFVFVYACACVSVIVCTCRYACVCLCAWVYVCVWVWVCLSSDYLLTVDWSVQELLFVEYLSNTLLLPCTGFCGALALYSYSFYLVVAFVFYICQYSATQNRLLFDLKHESFRWVTRLTKK